MSRIQVNSKWKSNQVFKKSALSLCVAAVTSPAFAQVEAELEEVVVYGVKQSLSTAQDIKRDAATVKDVITASDIGALPDKSIVEALQRVPGVAIERFEASDDPDHFSVEGSRVTIRGLNRVTGHFNGREVFSAGKQGGLNFSDIPPELVGSVEVTKNTEASQVAGGSSGTVDIITRKPLDSGDLVLGGTVRASYGDKIDELTPAVSFIVSNAFETDLGTFGALLSLSVSNFTSRGEGMGVYNYYGTADLGGTVIQDQMNNPAALPPAFRLNVQENDRDRLGIAGSLQWESPSEDILATLEFIRSDSTLAWTERVVEMAEQPFSGNIPPAIAALDSSGFTFSCGGSPSVTDPCLFRSGTFNYSAGVVGNNLPFITVSRAREEERLVNDVSFNVEFNVSDNFKLTGDLQYVDAETKIVDNTAHGRFSNAGPNGSNISNTLPVNYEFEVGGNEPGFEILNGTAAPFGTGTRFDNSDNYFWRSAMDHLSDNEGEQIAFSLDGEYAIEDSLLTAIKSGVRFANRDITVRESAFNWGNVSETWGGTNLASFSDIDGFDENGVANGETRLVESFAFDDHFSGKLLRNGLDTFWFPSLSVLSGSSLANLRDIIDTNPAFSGVNGAWTNLAARTFGAEPDLELIGPFIPSEIFETEEDRTSAYVQLDFGDEDADQPWSGNIGLRYVQWQVESTGAPTLPGGLSMQDINPALMPALDPEDIAFTDGAPGTTETVKGDNFSRVLPSFNFKFGVNDDLIFRFAASETVWFPRLDLIRNLGLIEQGITRTNSGGNLTGITINNNFIRNGGNPDLLPEISSNYDLALEYYFADVGSVTATLFHKRVRDFHRQAPVTRPVTNPRNDITRDVEVNSTVNSGVAVIQGYEIAYQTTFDLLFGENFEDFGLQASYTKIDGRVESSALTPFRGDAEETFGRFTDLPIEGLSDDNYNLVLFYDNATFNARFAYSWRSRYLLNSRDVIAFTPVYGEATGQLDASFSYQINDNFKVGLEANNLLDEVTKTSIQYNQEGVRSPRNFFVNDRRFALFVTATY